LIASLLFFGFLAAECLGNRLGDLGRSAGVWVDGVGDEFVVAFERGIDVDETKVQLLCKLGDHWDLVTGICVVDTPTAVFCDVGWKGQENTRLASELREMGNQVAIVLLVIGFKIFPVLWLGVIGAKHDHDNVRIGGKGGLELGALLIRAVTAFHQGSATAAKIFDHPLLTEKLLGLLGPRLPLLGTDALRDAVANAGQL